MKRRIVAHRMALSNHQHFPDVIAPQEDLTRSKVFEQVLNMAIVEDPLQWETLNRLQLQRIRLNNVMPRISRFRAGIFHMKKCQKVPFGLQDICQMLYERLDQGLGKIIRHVPAEDRVKMAQRKIQVLRKELSGIDLHGAVFLLDHILWILGFAEDILVVRACAQLCYEGDVGWRGGSKIEY